MYGLSEIVAMNNNVDLVKKGLDINVSGGRIASEQRPWTIPIVLMNDRAKVPTSAGNGYDLYYDGENPIRFTYMGHTHILTTGIKIALPEGYAAFIWDRSGLSTKQGLHRLAGVIDSNYRGELKVCLLSQHNRTTVIEPGDRIAQFVVQQTERLMFNVVDRLDVTDRNESGFGSTGK